MVRIKRMYINLYVKKRILLRVLLPISYEAIRRSQTNQTM
jgi:hypothetical protein